MGELQNFPNFSKNLKIKIGKKGRVANPNVSIFASCKFAKKTSFDPPKGRRWFFLFSMFSPLSQR